MYPYLRLARVIFSARFKPRLRMDGTSELKMRVWPNDIDTYPELNNGRHLILMDLGRIDFAARSGLLKKVHQLRWSFVVAGASVRYRRRLPHWGRFILKTRAAGYDHRWFYFYQETERDGKICSSALIRAGVLSKEGIVAAKKVLEVLGTEDWAPDLPHWIQAWIEADELRPQL